MKQTPRCPPFNSGREIMFQTTALFRERKAVNQKESMNDFDFSETTPEMKELFDSFVE
jgi:hypothetical protein